MTKIDGSQLNNRSVSHLKISRHTLTGAELNKKKLGTVENSRSLGGFPAADYSENVWATQQSSPQTLNSNKSPTTILKQSFFNDAPKKASIINIATVDVINNGNEAATVSLSTSVDGEVEPGTYSATVPPGSSQSIAGVLLCNGVPVGAHTMSLLARSTGTVELGTRADDGLRPIVVPPGHSSFTGEG